MGGEAEKERQPRMDGYLGHHSKASDCLPGGGQGGPVYVNYPPFGATCMHWGWMGCVP